MTRHRKFPASTLSVIIIFLYFFAVTPTLSKTRWSSLHIVPDADLFGSGEFTAGFDGYVSRDTSHTTIFKGSVPIRFGIIEWVNLDIGYCGGMTMGFKARILGETGKVMPSLAIGIHNLFNHKEAYLFYADSADDMAGEFYLALSKGIEPIKTRFHLGFQSIPTSEDDKINPFFAVEKYFGLGLYSSLEFYRRQKGYHFSLFANWRIMKKHLEISLGAVDLKSMFVDEDKKFAISLSPSEPGAFVKPGVWVGIKYHGRFGFGSNKGFITAEDRLKQQDETILMLVKDVNDLKSKVKETTSALDSARTSLNALIDSTENDPTKMRNIIYNKLVTLKSLYNSEPFDPDRVKLLIREITSYRVRAIPCLQELILDKKTDRYIRIYSAAMLGEMRDKGSSDILLDILARTTDPDIKIESLIALGKMKETRAMFLMEQLANSPNDAVALTAQEVLLRLSAETGADISPDFKMRKIEIDEKKTLVPEDKKRKPDRSKLYDTTKVVSKKVTIVEEDLTTGTKDTTAVNKTEGADKEVDVPADTMKVDSLAKSTEVEITDTSKVTETEIVVEKKEEKVEKSKEKEAAVKGDDKKEKKRDKKRDKKKDKKQKKKDKDRDQKKEDKKRDRKKGKEPKKDKRETKEERKKKFKAEKDW